MTMPPTSSKAIKGASLKSRHQNVRPTYRALPLWNTARVALETGSLQSGGGCELFGYQVPSKIPGCQVVVS